MCRDDRPALVVEREGVTFTGEDSAGLDGTTVIATTNGLYALAADALRPADQRGSSRYARACRPYSSPNTPPAASSSAGGPCSTSRPRSKYEWIRRHAEPPLS